MAMQCRRKLFPGAITEPGDFCWGFSESTDDRPSHIHLIEPPGFYVRLPIAPTPNGWDWDGNRDQPTLTPSIRTCRGLDGTWHGFLRRGELVEA